MTYTHLTTEEPFDRNVFPSKGSWFKNYHLRGGSRQTIHNVVIFLRKGYTALDYFKQYKKNKKRCGRHLLLYLVTNKNTVK